MDRRLEGRVAAAGDLVAVGIHDDEVVGRHRAVGQVVGGDEDEAGVGVAHANVALSVGDEVELGSQLGVVDDLGSHGMGIEVHRRLLADLHLRDGHRIEEQAFRPPSVAQILPGDVAVRYAGQTDATCSVRAESI